jgi:hypothetical protein
MLLSMADNVDERSSYAAVWGLFGWKYEDLYISVLIDFDEMNCIMNKLNNDLLSNGKSLTALLIGAKYLQLLVNLTLIKVMVTLAHFWTFH